MTTDLELYQQSKGIHDYIKEAQSATGFPGFPTNEGFEMICGTNKERATWAIRRLLKKGFTAVLKGRKHFSIHVKMTPVRYGFNEGWQKDDINNPEIPDCSK